MTTMMTAANPGELTLTRPQPRAVASAPAAGNTAPAAENATPTAGSATPATGSTTAAAAPTRGMRAPRSAAPQQTAGARPAEHDDDVIAALEAAAASLSVAIIEIFSGTRAPSSVGRWVAPDLFERIRAHAAYRQKLTAAAPPRPAMLAAGKPRVCLISERVAEAAVVVNTGRRHRAVALRLEHIRNRWLLTQLETA
ncbi:Rv3235 family protein [Brevibacterium otitidis]|uniref:Rv3235 family protein n=1 Tax=Brevibacterium otitidis TaxID=53364 RepID=A0ABV5X5W3_9MICO|nr:hypothetical protein GCM10023233_17740 [Brevibacterium otitidis]